MNIVITGSRGLAKELHNQLCQEHTVICVDRSTGHDIINVEAWAKEFYHYDVCINSAYSKWSQVDVLEQFYCMWKDFPKRQIVNIGSSVSDYSRVETPKEHEYMEYRLHKQALQSAFSKLVKQTQCDIKLINPGAINTDMIKHLNIDNKMSVTVAAKQIIKIMQDTMIKRVDLWL
jgi:short-subunit dehydrogenase